LLVLRDQFLYPSQLSPIEVVTPSQFDRWVEPELCLSVSGFHVDVEARLFAREKKKRNPSARKTVGVK
jgi:hypothetical protein